MRLRLLKAVLFATAFFMLVPAQAQIQLTPNRETITTNEAALQAGIRIDSGISVSGDSADYLRARLEGGVNGDLAGAMFSYSGNATDPFSTNGTELDHRFTVTISGIGVFPAALGPGSLQNISEFPSLRC